MRFLLLAVLLAGALPIAAQAPMTLHFVESEGESRYPVPSDPVTLVVAFDAVTFDAAAGALRASGHVTYVNARGVPSGPVAGAEVEMGYPMIPGPPPPPGRGGAWAMPPMYVAAQRTGLDGSFALMIPASEGYFPRLAPVVELSAHRNGAPSLYFTLDAE